MSRLFALLIAAALLLPAMGGALAVLAGAQSVVLCIGSERVRVTLDADGVPVQDTALAKIDCLTAPVSKPLARAIPPAAPAAPAAFAALPPAPLPSFWPRHNPARAPPRPV